jgi:hypothetical protein
MHTVEGLIGDLLLQHNCVIVPGFGGFVAQRVSAQIDMEKGIMLPPSKSILFNRQLINNDGLLISTYAASNKVTYPLAESTVEGAVISWHDALKAGQRVSIDRVGIIFLDQERNICFEQDRYFNLLLESYGLGPVHFISESDIQAKETITKVQEVVQKVDFVTTIDTPELLVLAATASDNEISEEQQAPIIPIHEKRPNKAWKYVAAAALVPLAFYSFWIPMKTDVLASGVISWNDFNPFYKKEVVVKKAPIVPVKKTVVPKEVLPETPIEQAPVETVQPEPIVAEKPVVVQEKLISPQIIVGSFSTVHNAKTMVKELSVKGFKATILQRDGKIRVSVGDSSQISVLEPQLLAIGIAPWILK